MKKRKVNRLLAVVLAATMAINPVTAGAAIDSSLELFQDGTANEGEIVTDADAEIVDEFEEVDVAEEMPLFGDGEEAEIAEERFIDETAMDVSENLEVPENQLVQKVALTEGKGNLIFAPTENGYYEFTFPEKKFGDVRLATVDNVSVAKIKASVYNLEVGKNYVFEVYCTDKALTEVDITITKVTGIKEITILDTDIKQECVKELAELIPDGGLSVKDGWNVGLNCRLQVTLSDGTAEDHNVEVIYNVETGNQVPGCGAIEGRLVDNDKNPVDEIEVNKEYRIQFYWAKNESVVSTNTIPCTYKSITSMNSELPWLNSETLVEVPECYKGMFIAQINANSNLANEPATYRIRST